jgi:hypothetical protein
MNRTQAGRFAFAGGGWNHRQRGIDGGLRFDEQAEQQNSDE